MFGSDEEPKLTLLSGAETREMPEVIQVGGAKQGVLGVIRYAQGVATLAVMSQAEVEIDDDDLLPPMYMVWASEDGGPPIFEELDWEGSYNLTRNVMIRVRP